MLKVNYGLVSWKCDATPRHYGDEGYTHEASQKLHAGVRKSFLTGNLIFGRKQRNFSILAKDLKKEGNVLFYIT